MPDPKETAVENVTADDIKGAPLDDDRRANDEALLAEAASIVEDMRASGADEQPEAQDGPEIAPDSEQDGDEPEEDDVEDVEEPAAEAQPSEDDSIIDADQYDIAAVKVKVKDGEVYSLQDLIENRMPGGEAQRIRSEYQQAVTIAQESQARAKQVEDAYANQEILSLAPHRYLPAYLELRVGDGTMPKVLAEDLLAVMQEHIDDKTYDPSRSDSLMQAAITQREQAHKAKADQYDQVRNRAVRDLKTLKEVHGVELKGKLYDKVREKIHEVYKEDGIVIGPLRAWEMVRSSTRSGRAAKPSVSKIIAKATKTKTKTEETQTGGVGRPSDSLAQLAEEAFNELRGASGF